MKIRKATLNDLYQLTDLTIKFKLELVQYSPEYMLPYRQEQKTTEEIQKNIKTEIENPTGRYLVATDKYKIIAFSYGSHKHTNHVLFKDIKYGTLNYIWIDKNYRHREIGTELKDKLLKWFKKEKCQYINLVVLEKNPAKKIFKKWGFDKVLSLM